MKFLRSMLAVIMPLTGMALIGAASAAKADDDSARWPFSGVDIHNTRNAANETRINASNVSRLNKKWAFVTHGEVSATPTVEAGDDGGPTIYAVDWGGYLYSLNGRTGVPYWSKKLTDYTGNTVASVSRTAPAIVGDRIIIGDQGDINGGGFPQHRPGQAGATTAAVMAINKHNGSLIWKTTVSDHPYSVVTSSPVAYGGVIYVGVSSLEENAGFIPGYPGFSWRGKVAALDAQTGTILWSTTTIDDAAYGQGFRGASVWGSTPAVDVKRGSLYVSTGNNYSAVSGYDTGGATDVTNNLQPCPAGDHFDSVLALSLADGHLKWSFRAWNGDTWDVARFVGVVLGTPDPTLGPDWDFGSGPNLFRTGTGELLGAGAKSGYYYALNPDTGAVVWKTQAGIGGTGGGIEWGSAVDGKQVYCAIANSDNKPNPVGVMSTQSYYGGNWVALDASTGKINWQTVDPLGGHDYGMVTVANGVVFAASAGQKPIAQINYPGAPGGFFALDASNGNVLWQFTAADDPDMGSVICGPSVVDGVVYWGSGYSHLSNAFGITGIQPKLYAFSLP